MRERDEIGLTSAEIEAQGATALPDREAMSVVPSLLDVDANLDLALDLAAPIDAAVAANANVAAPIDAAVGANILSVGSEAQAMADQGVIIDQGITGEAVADAGQDSTIDQAAEAPAATDAPADATTTSTDGATGAVTSDSALDGNLLNVDVDLAADLDLAAPIAGAVAANANVAAPIDAAVAANIGSIDSDAVALAQQDAIIVQDIDADANATTDQSSDISQ